MAPDDDGYPQARSVRQNLWAEGPSSHQMDRPHPIRSLLADGSPFFRRRRRVTLVLLERKLGGMHPGGYMGAKKVSAVNWSVPPPGEPRLMTASVGGGKSAKSDLGDAGTRLIGASASLPRQEPRDGYRVLPPRHPARASSSRGAPEPFRTTMNRHLVLRRAIRSASGSCSRPEGLR